jgi:uncharacterized protein
MSLDTLGRTFEWVFAGGLAREPFTLLWHAGEPMVMPVSFYEEATRLLGQHNRAGVAVHQSFQTNATLLDEAWCAFIRDHDIHLGVSVDGPAYLHDGRRRTRQGRGTLDRVLRGIRLLHEHGIPFHVITVLTADSLSHADELFDFYQEHRISRVCFNVEEIEGPNTTSSLQGAATKERFRRFFARFVVGGAPDAGPRVRHVGGGPGGRTLRAGVADPGEQALGHRQRRLRRELQHLLAGVVGAVRPALRGLRPGQRGPRFAR